MGEQYLISCKNQSILIKFFIIFPNTGTASSVNEISTQLSEDLNMLVLLPIKGTADWLTVLTQVRLLLIKEQSDKGLYSLLKGLVANFRFSAVVPFQDFLRLL